MPRKSSHPFDTLIEHAAGILAEGISAALAKAAPKPGRAGRAPDASLANQRRSSAMKGRKLDMSCRVEGCKNRSGGPRRGFMCEEHQKLPKKQQQAAREAWNAAHAA